MPFKPLSIAVLTLSYDYIIAGAGCAGLSLVLRLVRDPFFRQKKILLIDQDAKQRNDRTWCFWEQQPGLFEPIVYHSWPTIDFYSSSFSARFDLTPYRYKMLRGIDFYRYVFQELEQYPLVTVLEEKIAHITQGAGEAVVTTATARCFRAPYVFSSLLDAAHYRREALRAGKYFLLQHFKGWIIETTRPVFRTDVATFMDFRIDQDKGTAFVYLLPLQPGRALVEYTLFSPNLLPPEAYDAALKDYLHRLLQLPDYQVVEEETGVIPMTDFTLPRAGANIIPLGTAGGYTKASSGYTFQFVQKHTTAIVQQLKKGGSPDIHLPLQDRRFRLYDRTLLHILQREKMQGHEVFATLFRNNRPQTILRFLDNESSLAEEINIMRTMPSGIFLPAALQELIKF